MNAQDRERMAVVETKLETLHDDIKEIKQALKDHTEWEESKYQALDKKYAGKWIERIAIPALTTIIGALITYSIAIL